MRHVDRLPRVLMGAVVKPAWDILTAQSIELAGATLLRTADADTESGARLVSFTDGITEVQVHLWPNDATVLELLERGEFLYACSESDPKTAFERLRGYVADREQARKAAP